MEFANSSAQWRTMVLAVLKFHVLLPERKLHRLTNDINIGNFPIAML
jgi:hypothetical protein